MTSAVNQLRNALTSVHGQVDTANRVVQLAPAMLGADGDRSTCCSSRTTLSCAPVAGFPALWRSST